MPFLTDSAAIQGFALEFGVFLVCTYLSGLQIYLCAGGYLKYRRSHPTIQSQRRSYVRMMVLILSVSTSAFILALVSLYKSLYFHLGKVSAKVAMWAEIATAVFIGQTHLTADGLLVWRCYVIWTGRPWLGLAPLPMYMASLGLGLLTLVTYGKCEGFMRDGACGSQSNVFNQGMYYVVATSVNVTATTLICVRLLLMKRKLASTARLPGSFGGGGPYGRVSMILIESALPFTVVGVLCSILAFVGPDPPWFFVSRLWTMASALAAQLIIYRVITGVSWTSNPESESDAISHSIHFAADVPHHMSAVSGIQHGSLP